MVRPTEGQTNQIFTMLSFAIIVNSDYFSKASHVIRAYKLISILNAILDCKL